MRGAAGATEIATLFDPARSFAARVLGSFLVAFIIRARSAAHSDDSNFEQSREAVEAASAPMHLLRFKPRLATILLARHARIGLAARSSHAGCALQASMSGITQAYSSALQELKANIDERVGHDVC